MEREIVLMWKAHGLKCMVVKISWDPVVLERTRLRNGHNGYVTVPKGHPAYGVDYNDIELGEHTPHGGLTYSGEGERGKGGRRGWMFGFDTQHADSTPQIQSQQWVERETERLAAGLALLTLHPDYTQTA